MYVCARLIEIIPYIVAAVYNSLSNNISATVIKIIDISRRNQRAVNHCSNDELAPRYIVLKNKNMDNSKGATSREFTRRWALESNEFLMARGTFDFYGIHTRREQTRALPRLRTKKASLYRLFDMIYECPFKTSTYTHIHVRNFAFCALACTKGASRLL